LYGIRTQYKQHLEIQWYEECYNAFGKCFINIYYIKYYSKFFLGRKRDREKRSFNEAVEKATIELVGNPTNIGLKFNSSNKPKWQKRSSTIQLIVVEPKTLTPLEKAQEEAEIQKLLAETEHIKIQNKL
jgi:hypothetical protein